MSPLLPQEIIRKKRDGEALDEAAISCFVTGMADGSISEGQVAAFAMAVFVNGMEAGEQAALTRAMTTSGRVLDWRQVGLDGPTVDKHSTGGVGDKVSLILAPLVAACGAYVPMISGRGLGHSGGTMDKLESIPGYNPTPDLETFVRTTREVGCSITGQTAELAPADQRLYAVRDVTATIKSVPLITASILSKKLAAGLDFLVMDVKFGSGAFMRLPEEARALAINIIEVAGAAGLPTAAVLSDMNQVLGHSAGNALEVLEAVDFLKGNIREPRLEECVLVLAGEMLAGAGLAIDHTEGRALASSALESGSAASTFARMVAAHGGPTDLIERADEHLEKAPVIRPVKPLAPGTISAMDVRAIGMTVVRLGGGRSRTDEPIDAAVGLSEMAGIGEEVGDDAPIAFVHARDEASAEEAAQALGAAITVSETPVEPTDVVREVIPAASSQ
jgi:thymidine phosphorylase